MSRRLKLILLILGSLALFAFVGWYFVWPAIKPLVPARAPASPPTLPGSIIPQMPQPSGSADGTGGAQPGGSGAASFDPSSAHPDAQIIADLSRRAGILAERVESGSSQDGFRNLDDAQLNVSPTLAATFRARGEALRAQYPASGALYLVLARRLVERPEGNQFSGSTFYVTVQLQLRLRDDASESADTTRYLDATVTFTQSGGSWIVSGYETKETIL